MTDRLLLDERILGDGHLARTYASFVEGQLHIDDQASGPDSAHGALSIAAVDRVMVRYGLPLEQGLRVEGDALDLGDGRALRRYRFHAKVDAEARDYLVWERPGEEPIAVLATHATAALRYLVLRLGEERRDSAQNKAPQESEG
ncbi:MAG TPA: hypothetical protein VMZ53_20130 [Kofleriaceae bacterium]|nr:hypothetical protein [Kofleriaceae bacterium]